MKLLRELFKSFNEGVCYTSFYIISLKKIWIKEIIIFCMYFHADIRLGSQKRPPSIIWDTDRCICMYINTMNV